MHPTATLATPVVREIGRIYGQTQMKPNLVRETTSIYGQGPE